MGIQEEIAQVAYELYEKRGKAHGLHVNDWLEAEKIVMARNVRREGAKEKPSKSGKAKATVKTASGKRVRSAAKVSSRKKTTGKKPTEKT